MERIPDQQNRTWTNPASFPVPLPAGMQVFERGWLSSNSILFLADESAAVVDTGYATHSSQTVALVRSVIGARKLDLILNTHLHSDHCGGNAALQREFPSSRTLIPPGLSRFVRNWDRVGLTYEPTGQQCPPFTFQGLLQPGQKILLGGADWQIHGAPGHDPHSVILYEPLSRTLISADALWENGFGVVFEELEGGQAFAEVAATLDFIDSLAPRVVIPGHGAVFYGVARALAVARSKLDGFVRDPPKHARHAAKVLLKFKLLELQRTALVAFVQWAVGTPYLLLVHRRFFSESALQPWIEQLISELLRSGAARLECEQISNA